MSLDDHLGRITARSYAALATALTILNSQGMSYVLIGGWAVFAYESRIPSIDTDIMLSKGEAEAFRRHLKAEGKGDQEGPGKHIES